MRDQTEIARLEFVTRTRVTQIMNLLNLAPKIQEAILFLPPVTEGKDRMTERIVRATANTLDWSRQHQMLVASKE